MHREATPLSHQRVLKFQTTHGWRSTGIDPDERVIDSLNRNLIAWSSVSLFIEEKSGSLSPFPCLEKYGREIPLGSTLCAILSRNIQPFGEAFAAMDFVDTDIASPAVSEFIYRQPQPGGHFQSLIKKLSIEECRTIVRDRCHAALDGSLTKISNEIIVGVSGGGDSNALLHGLTTYTKSPLRVRAVIVSGIPDWDHGIPRAQELCAQYGMPLTIVSEQETRAFLGIQGREPMIERFERHFPGDDFEFLGTLIIRQALLGFAKSHNINTICTGLNLEDLLAEALYRVQAGLPPVSAPVRNAICNPSHFVPLWNTPKKIIDGCFPKFSLENYEARYPCFSWGRSLFYQMAYSLQSNFPETPERILSGLSRIAEQIGHEPIHDFELGFEVLREVPLPLKTKFMRMLRD